MTKRFTITPKMKVLSLLHHFGARCARCGKLILATDEIEWDHSHPLGLGGPHHYTNIKPLHVDCHVFKTSGAGATTAGSDIGKISKVKRIVRTCKFTVSKRAPGEPKPVTRWTGRKLKSRPFEKGHRPMRRRVA